VIIFAIAVALMVSLLALLLLDPLVRTRGSSFLPGVSPSRELLARRDRIYDELRELEFDYRVGKVTTIDYREAQAQLEIEAARVLQAIDGRVRAIEDEIEGDVQRLRQSRGFCPACGAPIATAARFCAGCGARLELVARR
jgi:hypothetical protein